VNKGVAGGFVADLGELFILFQLFDVVEFTLEHFFLLILDFEKRLSEARHP